MGITFEIKCDCKPPTSSEVPPSCSACSNSKFDVFSFGAVPVLWLIVGAACVVFVIRFSSQSRDNFRRWLRYRSCLKVSKQHHQIGSTWPRPTRS